MKEIFSRNKAIYLTGILGLLISTIANADWSIKGVGTLAGIGVSSAGGINEPGQIIGNSHTAAGGSYQALFITGNNGIGMTELDTLGAYSYPSAINDSGQIAGIFTTARGVTHAFSTGRDGVGMTDLGTLGGRFSFASDINNSGQVVGGSYTTGTDSIHAFVTDANGIGMRDLGTLGGTYSYANAVNNSGQVVGYSQTADGQFHSFITGVGGVGMHDLGTLGGKYSFANSINEHGQVVGYSETAEGHLQAFITNANGAGMTKLHVGGNSIAVDINNLGQVLGYSGDDAFIVGANGGKIELSALDVIMEDGWSNIHVVALNNHGQIVGFGQHHNNSNEAFLLSFTEDTVFPAPIPEPQTYAMLLAGLGLLGGIACRKKTIKMS